MPDIRCKGYKRFAETYMSVGYIYTRQGMVPHMVLVEDIVVIKMPFFFRWTELVWRHTRQRGG